MSKQDTLVNQKNPVYRQDITVSINHDCLPADSHSSPISKEELEDIFLDDFIKPLQSTLGHVCQKYVFSLEETYRDDYTDGWGNLHFQCRVNLRTKNRWRPSQLSKYLAEQLQVGGAPMAYRITCSPTAKATGSNFDYVMKKDETHRLGPFADRPFFLGESILRTDQLLPWHLLLLEKLNKPFEYRKIIHILDIHGHNQKSSFIRYLLWHFPNEIGIINCFGTTSQISSAIVSMGAKKYYVLDLPRSYSWEETGKDGIVRQHWNKQWRELSYLLEQLKNGLTINNMYGQAEHLLQDPPHIVIMSNWELESHPGDYFSHDRLETIDLLDHGHSVHDVHSAIIDDKEETGGLTMTDGSRKTPGCEKI